MVTMSTTSIDHSNQPLAGSPSTHRSSPTPIVPHTPSAQNRLHKSQASISTPATHSKLQAVAGSPSVLVTPSRRPVLSTKYNLGNIQSTPINQTLPSNLSGVTFQSGQNDVGAFDVDAMKRALDTSSLPINPVNGQQPHIDSTSSFENIPPKKPRTSESPNFPIHQSSSPQGAPPAPILNNAHIQGFSAYPSGSTFSPPPLPLHAPGSINGYPMTNTGVTNPHPTSPLSLGGPLATPTQPGSAGGHQSPFMSMGMNFAHSFPYMNYNPASPIVSPSMNPSNMTGNYGPAAAAAAAAAAGNTTGRTVYIGNLPSEASVDELLNLVRFGPIEQVRLLPEKSCVFISFLDGSTAAAFHADASVKKLALHGQELKIGWGKPSLVPASIAQAVIQNQATRNVFVGGLPEDMNEQDLRNTCSKFGPIDQVKIVRDKNIGFIHFLSISAAMKVVAQLPHEQGWQDRKVYYGKDRCAYVPKAQQAAVQAAQAQAAAAMSSHHAQMPGSPYVPFSPMSPSFSAFGSPGSAFASPMFNAHSNGFNNHASSHAHGHAGFNNDPSSFGSAAAAAAALTAAQNASGGNRTIYIGNIHPDTTTEELCNNIRGGIIQQIKHMKDKNIAFVTFVDPQAAMTFYNYAYNGLTVGGRKLKLGWGKISAPPSAGLLHAIGNGATRNVYIGQISDFDTFNEEKLRADFGQYGEIEMINFLTEKGAAFVNFTEISAAQKAIEGIKSQAEYGALRISYGKDRCANPPRGMMPPPNGVTSTPNGSNGSGFGRPSGERSVSQTSVPDPNDAISAHIAAIERGQPMTNGNSAETNETNGSTTTPNLASSSTMPQASEEVSME